MPSQRSTYLRDTALVGGIASAGADKLLGFVEGPIEAAAEYQDHLARFGGALGDIADKTATLARCPRSRGGEPRQSRR